MPKKSVESFDAEKECKRGKMNKTMGEFKKGSLKSKNGDTVVNRKQAVAIGLSQSKKCNKFHDARIYFKFNKSSKGDMKVWIGVVGPTYSFEYVVKTSENGYWYDMSPVKDGTPEKIIKKASQTSKSTIQPTSDMIAKVSESLQLVKVV